MRKLIVCLTFAFMMLLSYTDGYSEALEPAGDPVIQPSESPSGSSTVGEEIPTNGDGMALQPVQGDGHAGDGDSFSGEFKHFAIRTRFGLNVSFFSSLSKSERYGPVAGLDFEYFFVTEPDSFDFGLSLGSHYLQRGFRVDNGDTVRSDFVAVPVLMTFRYNSFGLSPYFFIGPKLNILLSSNLLKGGDVKYLFKEFYHELSVSLWLGAGFDIYLHRDWFILSFELSWDVMADKTVKRALADQFDIPEGRDHGVSLTTGVKFMLF